METELFEKVQYVFRDVMDNDNLVITSQCTADDIEEWDSLTNIQLIVALEKTFNIKFTSVEIPTLKNIGDIVKCIASKL